MAENTYVPHEDCFYSRVKKDQSITLRKAVFSLLQVRRPGCVFIGNPVGSVRMTSIDGI